MNTEEHRILNPKWNSTRSYRMKKVESTSASAIQEALPDNNNSKLKTQNSKLEKDPRNRLNDLTGREWVHFLSSVEATAYPTAGPNSYGHNLRRAHPSPKPPQLMRRIIE